VRLLSNFHVPAPTVRIRSAETRSVTPAIQSGVALRLASPLVPCPTASPSGSTTKPSRTCGIRTESGRTLPQSKTLCVAAVYRRAFSPRGFGVRTNHSWLNSILSQRQRRAFGVFLPAFGSQIPSSSSCSIPLSPPRNTVVIHSSFRGSTPRDVVGDPLVCPIAKISIYLSIRKKDTRSLARALQLRPTDHSRQGLESW
jgi:hypothetical protein